MVHIVVFTILPDSKVWFRCRCCTELNSQPCSLGSPICACLVPFRQGWWPFYYFSDLFPHNSTITYWTLRLWMGSWSLWRQSLPWDGVVVWMAASLIGLYNCMLHPQLMNSLRRCVTANRLWVFKNPRQAQCLSLPACGSESRASSNNACLQKQGGQSLKSSTPRSTLASHTSPQEHVLTPTAFEKGSLV